MKLRNKEAYVTLPSVSGEDKISCWSRREFMECLCKISLAEIGELLQLLKEELNVCEWKNTIRLLKKKTWIRNELYHYCLYRKKRFIDFQWWWFNCSIFLNYTLVLDYFDAFRDLSVGDNKFHFLYAIVWYEWHMYHLQLNIDVI